jgi:hypothetical protein
MDPEQFRAKSAKQRLVGLTGNEAIIYAWDWDQPAYCRAQLLALGFTEANLTP